ncbi:hypothetical protein Ate01nite_70520 [Actinoplanes teichomyceticus]|nr:hypothetical protein Ate01nite_70520 [Actinoplanes teichomyceticus]
MAVIGEGREVSAFQVGPHHRRRTTARSWAAPPLLLSVTLAAGPLGLPDAAHAATPTTRAAAVPAAACRPGTAANADRAVADQLRPLMNGRRLGSSVNAGSIACARVIVRNVQARGLPRRAAVIAVTTAIAESTLHNYTIAVDHDSLGLFQQRPSMGWGLPGELTDPDYATNAFLDAMIRKHPGGSWRTGDIGQICQRVQISGKPAAYSPEVHDAQLIVDRVWAGAGAPAASPATTPATPTTTPTPLKQANGPFQRSLAVTPTGLAPADERHHISMADWNGDRRADMVVVQGAGTTTGRTEVRVLNGATNFQALVLNTATALGPADQRYAFSVADWNGDGRPDLVAVQRSGTASGRTELRVVDGASSFQRLLVDTTTMLAPTDERHSFAVADWNSDGHNDVVVTRKSGPGGRRTEVGVLDGAANFQRDLLQAPVTLPPTDDRHDIFVADWNADRRPDAVIVQKSGTTSGLTEVRILDGATTFRSDLLQASTPHGTTGARDDLSVADWNGDGRLDLLVARKSGTTSGWTEAHVLGG